MEGLVLAMLGKYLKFSNIVLVISSSYVRYEDANIWVKYQIQTWIKILGLITKLD
jgi:hypothetical protein